MKQLFQNLLKYAVFLGIGILLVWLVVRNLTPSDISEIKNAFLTANYWVVALSCLIGILSHYFRAVRWKMLMQPMGFEPTISNTFWAVIVGYIVNLAIPRAGEVSRCGVLSKYENIPVEKSLGTVVMERLLDVLMLGIILVFVVFTQYSLYSSILEKNVFVPLREKSVLLTSPTVIAIIVLSIVMMIVGVLLFRKKRQKRTVEETPSQGRIKNLLKGFWNGLISIKDVKNKPKLILYSFLIWGMYLCTSLINFHALQETSHLGFDTALSILVWGTFGFIFVQGGIGAFQLIAMQTLMLYGITKNIGFAMGWIIWTAQTAVVILLGVVAVLILPILNKNKNGTTAINP